MTIDKPLPNISSANAIGDQHGKITDLPIGFRFVPTDEELAGCYLSKKISNSPIAPGTIIDIDANELYGKHPKILVENGFGHENAWYFFTHHIHGEKETIRIVGDEIGFWRGVLADDLIYDSNGEIIAAKTYWRYFEGPTSRGRQTYWRMEEYRLKNNTSTNTTDDDDACNMAVEQVLIKIKKGTNYNYD